MEGDSFLVVAAGRLEQAAAQQTKTNTLHKSDCGQTEQLRHQPVPKEIDGNAGQYAIDGDDYDCNSQNSDCSEKFIDDFHNISSKTNRRLSTPV